MSELKLSKDGIMAVAGTARVSRILGINPNTVSRAYTELELTGLVETQMGSGTFVGSRQVMPDDVERRRILDQLCQEFLSRASTHGFTLDDVLQNLEQRGKR